MRILKMLHFPATKSTNSMLNITVKLYPFNRKLFPTSSYDLKTFWKNYALFRYETESTQKVIIEHNLIEIVDTDTLPEFI